VKNLFHPNLELPEPSERQREATKLRQKSVDSLSTLLAGGGIDNTLDGLNEQLRAAVHRK